MMKSGLEEMAGKQPEQTINTGGPAFPSPEYRGPNDYTVAAEYGMTLRQWYAGMALQGIATRCSWSADEIPEHANLAFEFADAMIAAETV